jgi:hypothetical protein
VICSAIVFFARWRRVLRFLLARRWITTSLILIRHFCMIDRHGEGLRWIFGVICCVLCNSQRIRSVKNDVLIDIDVCLSCAVSTLETQRPEKFSCCLLTSPRNSCLLDFESGLEGAVKASLKLLLEIWKERLVASRLRKCECETNDSSPAGLIQTPESGFSRSTKKGSFRAPSLSKFATILWSESLTAQPGF